MNGRLRIKAAMLQPKQRAAMDVRQLFHKGGGNRKYNRPIQPKRCKSWLRYVNIGSCDRRVNIVPGRI